MTPPAAARELELNLAQGRLAARAWGDATLPPVLALHGWLDNAASFDRLAPLLADCLHIVAIDLPGHGRSDWRAPGASYHFVDYVLDVIAAADALGWQRFSLLGHSLGGAIASVFAAACPQRVDNLLLIEALGPLSKPVEETLTQLQRAIHDRQRTSGRRLRVFANRSEAANARAQANSLSRAAAAILIERGVKTVPGGYSWSSDPRLTQASPQRFSEAQVQAIIRAIRAPTLLITAQPSVEYVDREIFRQRIDCVTGIRAVTLPGGHHLHLEDPQPVAATVRGFLSC